jgi:hypothetical protein
MNAVILTRNRSLFRSSPDKGRAGGVCRSKTGFPRMIYCLKPPSIPPYQGGSGLASVIPHLMASFMRSLYKINPYLNYHHLNSSVDHDENSESC